MYKPIEVFWSYAHKDEALRDKLEAHLSPLQNEGMILPWYDRTIGPGAEWNHEIDEHIRSAGIILLLVSADFLRSEYCRGVEMQQAIHRHDRGEARVVPVILRPCDWHSAPFGKLQALPRDGKPVTKWSNKDEAYTQIATGLRKVVSIMRVQEDVPRETAPRGRLSASREMRSVGHIRGGVAKPPAPIAAINSEAPFKVLRTYQSTLDYLEGLIKGCSKRIWTVRTHAGEAAAEGHLFDVLLARLGDRSRPIQEVRRNIRLVNSDGTREHLCWLVQNLSELIPVKVRYFEGTGPRFDFIIVDGSKAVLGLPMASGEGVEVSIVIEDTEVVRCMEQAFEDLWNSSKRLFNGVPGLSSADKLKLAKHIDRQLKRLDTLKN